MSWVGSDTYDGTSPQPGRRFVLVEQLLSNVSADPLSLSPNFFSVDTDTGIVVTISSSAIPDDVCPGDASVSAGASFGCALLFELPEDATPVTLGYEDPVSGLSASAQFGTQEVPDCSGLDGPPSCRYCIEKACPEIYQTFLYSACGKSCAPYGISPPEGTPAPPLCDCIARTEGCAEQLEPILTCAQQYCVPDCNQ